MLNRVQHDDSTAVQLLVIPGEDRSSTLHGLTELDGCRIGVRHDDLWTAVLFLVIPGEDPESTLHGLTELDGCRIGVRHDDTTTMSNSMDAESSSA